MVHVQLVPYDVERSQERRTIEPGERMGLITPDAGALFVLRQFTNRTGRPRGTYCSVFRRERGSWPAPEMILAADRWAWAK